jgi:hypothetical protein
LDPLGILSVGVFASPTPPGFEEGAELSVVTHVSARNAYGPSWRLVRFILSFMSANVERQENHFDNGTDYLGHTLITKIDENETN